MIAHNRQQRARWRSLHRETRRAIAMAESIGESGTAERLEVTAGLCRMRRRQLIREAREMKTLREMLK